MRLRNYLLYILGFLPTVIWANINISGVINDYAKVTGITFPDCDICDTTRVCLNAIELNSSAAFSPGDKALIIQMKGATINTSNTPLGGSITDIGNAGNYEFITIRAVEGNTVYPLRQLTKGYDVPGLIQLVRIPNYDDDVTVTGQLEALPWNPTTGLGGVLALFVNGNLTLNADLNTNGMGYIGEVVNVNGSPDNCSRNPENQYIGPATNNDLSPKGNGIVVNDPNTNGGRAPRANGGGGGISGDAGGGGGSNYGAGGDGGNRWCDHPTPAGGKGGWSLQPYLPLNKVFLGGAGGPGFVTNNNSAEAANGGGIIVIKADNLIANNRTIDASGTSPAAPGSGIDGGGGGGAGGTVALSVDNVIGDLNVDISGGNGQSLVTHVLHGPGGGGGGGALLHNLGTLPGNVAVDFAGGTAGVHGGSNAGVTNGSQDGEPGGVVYIPNIIRDYEIGTVAFTNAVCGCNGIITFSDFYSTGTMQYSIDGGSNYQTNPSFGDVCEGVYAVQAVDEAGCIYDTTLIVGNDGYELSLDLGSDQNICEGTSINIGVANVDSLDYVWNTGATNSIISISTQGEYILITTDDNECTGTDTIQVDVWDPAITLTTDDVSCNGLSDGEISSSTSGGGTITSYAWSNGQNTANISGIGAGTYTLTITDEYGCSAVESTTISQPDILSVSLNEQNLTCYNEGDGSISSTITGGTAPYSYNWNQGSTSANINSLDIGNYSITVTDSEGCSATASTTLTQPDQLVITPTRTNVQCNGSATGSASVSVTGGEAPYSYSWNIGNNTNSVNGLSIGSYGVIITDANGCSAPQSFTITQPDELSITITGNDLSCFEAADGEVTSTVTGGTTPYSFNWSNGATTQDIASLTAGTYSVTLTDANGCSATASTSINQPDELTISVAGNNLSCFEAGNGEVTSTVTGGTTPYSFNWSNGASTQDIANLTAGTYSVTLTDANGCSTTASTTITQPNELTLSVVGNNLTCFENNSGEVTSTVAGGTTPYSFNWSNGAPTQDIASLTAGTYSVTLTDANGCSATASTNITQPDELALSTIAQNLSCFEAGNGEVTSTVTGGTTPYSFNWSNGASTQDIASLTAGTYSVTLTDANGCSATASTNITQPDDLTLSVVGNNLTCFEAGNGEVTSTVTGGTTPYSFNWSNGASTQDIASLTTGTYSVTLTDANGCSATASTSINQPDELALSITAQNLSCFEAADGEVTSTVAGGTTPYTFNWSNGASAQDIASLTAGTFTVTLTDANGCSVSASTTITQPDELTISVAGQNLSCFEAGDGEVNSTVAGGTTPYTFNWSNGASSQNISSLTAGTYSVSLTDANGCSATASTSITQPDELTISVAGQNLSCFEAGDGEVTSTVAGGTTPYTFNWSNGASTQDISGLTAGTYSVTLTDANGCSATASISITQPDELTISVAGNNLSCFENNSGEVTSTVTGGTAPYSFNWSNGASTQDIASLTTGTYSVTLTDANGCSATASTNITQPDDLTLSVVGNNLSCFENNSGEVTSTVAGGTTPYTFNWSNGASTQDIANLSAGSYSVTLTDANGCSATASTSITQPDELTISVAGQNLSCFEAGDGEVTSTVTGGTTPYTFNWSNGGTAQDIASLTAGTYSVTLTDANGCSATASTSITQPDDLTISLEMDSTYCSIDQGYVHSTISGGTAPYTYNWNTGANTSDINNLVSGTYTLQVNDNNGCSVDTSVVIYNRPAPSIILDDQRDISCFGGDNGRIVVSLDGYFNNPLDYQWTKDGENITANQSSLSGLSAGNYAVTITDDNGCAVDMQNIILTEPNALSIDATIKNVSCNDGNNGEIDLTISGGTAPYNYLWNDMVTSEDRTNLPEGTYTVRVRDILNCLILDTFEITAPEPLSLLGDTKDENCQLNNGEAWVIANGGVGPYNYAWNTGATSDRITNLQAGDYTVNVNDQNQCNELLALHVDSTPTPKITIERIENATCFEDCDGIAEVSFSQPLTNYYFNWKHNNENSPIQTGLCAGEYEVLAYDDFGCRDSVNLNIAEPLPLTNSTTVTEPLCYDDCNGVAATLTEGGNGNYQYTWIDTDFNTVSSSSNPTNLCAGNYQLNISDDKGCSLNESVQIDNPAPFVVNAQGIDPLCFESCDGQVFINQMTGSEITAIQWTNADGQSATDSLWINRCEGTYYLTTENEFGCISNDTVSIAHPDQLIFSSISIQDVACFGDSNGGIQMTISGGTGSYDIQWMDNVSNQNRNGLSAGEYCVTIMDENGCSIDTCLQVGTPQPLSIQLNAQALTCFESCDGSASPVIAGGTLPYNYAWNNGSSDSALTGLCAIENLNVIVTDHNGCQISDSIEITQPNRISLTADVTDANCNMSNGRISITTDGGIGNHTYSWENGSTANIIAQQSAGCYNVTVQDENGCVLDTTICINNIDGPTLTIDSTKNVSCFEGTDGLILASAQGGTGNLSLRYKNNASTTWINTDGTIANLARGCYTIQAVDEAGCISTQSVCIDEPRLLEAFAQVSQIIDCYDKNTGELTGFAQGGTAPYRYFWSNGFNAAVNPNVYAGDYILTIRDANNCSADTIISITQPTRLIISDINAEDNSCYNACDGQVAISIAGGTTPYQTAWNNGQNGPHIQNLCAGNYSAEIIDGNGCRTAASVNITEPDSLIATSITSPTTCNRCNGEAEIIVQGGTGPFLFDWNGAGNNLTYNFNKGICEGPFTVNIDDVNGCSISITDTIDAINLPVIDTIYGTPPTCFNSLDGQMTVAVSGIEPFQYLWDNKTGNQTSTIATDLNSGNYCVQVADANGCKVVACDAIDKVDEVIATEISSNRNCFGETTQFWVAGQGGTSPYSIDWLDSDFDGFGPHSITITGDLAYKYIITDTNGCKSVEETLEIKVKDDVTVTLDSIAPICVGDTVDIHATANGGSGVYEFRLLYGEDFTQAQFVNVLRNEGDARLSIDTTTQLMIVVNDGCAMPARDTITVSTNKPLPIALEPSRSQGCSPLEVTFFVEGYSNDATYLYDFDGDGNIDETSTSDKATYTYRDARNYRPTVQLIADDNCTNGAKVTNDIYVNEQPILDVEVSHAQPLTMVSPRVTFEAALTGAEWISWDFGNGAYDEGYATTSIQARNTDGTLLNPIHTFADSGTYVVTALAENRFGCLDTFQTTLRIEPEFTFYAPNAFTPNNNGINETFFAKGIGWSTEGFSFDVFNRWGEHIFHTNDINGQWDGRYMGNLVQTDVYVWLIEVKDFKGNSHFFKGTVTVLSM
jgi:gliding motility-associated-like protein